MFIYNLGQCSHTLDSQGEGTNSLLVDSLEVLELASDGRLDGLITLLEVGRADFAVLSDVLVSLNETENLINGATSRGVVLGDVLNDTLVVDDDGAARVVATRHHAAEGGAELVVEVLYEEQGKMKR